MKIEICGPGCARCHAAMDNVQQAVKKLVLEQSAEVTEVKDMTAISTRGVFLTPAVLIDGVKVCEGRVPKTEEVETWLKEKR